LTGTSPIFAFQHAILDASIGTSALLRCNAFQLVGNDGWQSTPLASVALARRWLSEKSSQLRHALAAVKTKMLGMYGYAKNLRYFLFGHSLCIPSVRIWNRSTEIIFWIIRRLTEWRSQESLSLIRTDLPGLRQAIEAQDSIGWQAFFDRPFSKTRESFKGGSIFDGSICPMWLPRCRAPQPE
jgi:hypothetical protein